MSKEKDQPTYDAIAPQARKTDERSERKPGDPGTPLQHAFETGNTVYLAQTATGQPATVPNATHAAASALHGWDDHAMHYGDKPIVLSLRDYQDALESAAAAGCADDAHPSALAPRFRELKKIRDAEKKAAEAAAKG